MENNRRKFYEVLRALAATTKTEMTQFMLDRYLEQLEPLGLDKVNTALMAFFDGSTRNSFMPSINAVKDKLGVKNLSEDDIARDTIQKIRYAIGRFGAWNYNEALDYIGPIGRHVVQSMGGWEQVCGFETYKELDFALVQAREYAKVAIKRGGDVRSLGFDGKAIQSDKKYFEDNVFKLGPKK